MCARPASSPQSDIYALGALFLRSTHRQPCLQMKFLVKFRLTDPVCIFGIMLNVHNDVENLESSWLQSPVSMVNCFSNHCFRFSSRVVSSMKSTSNVVTGAPLIAAAFPIIMRRDQRFCRNNALDIADWLQYSTINAGLISNQTTPDAIGTY